MNVISAKTAADTTVKLIDALSKFEDVFFCLGWFRNPMSKHVRVYAPASNETLDVEFDELTRSYRRAGSKALPSN